MAGILGSSQPRHSILGGFNPIRQIAMPQGRPMQQQASPMMGMGGMMGGQGGVPDGYGSDSWALQTGGPGALIFREMVRSMSGEKNPLAFLDPDTKAFSPWLRQYLEPQFQKHPGK